MFVDNRTTFLKRKVLTAVAELFFADRMLEDINRLPAKLIPRSATPHRCCIEKDREIIRQRIIAALGFGLEDETEVDMTLLSDYAKKSLRRENPDATILSFMDEGCKACIQVNYYVTDVCRNCVAKPCIMNCPKDAITADEKKATINSHKCINCGVCLKVCPYHAIVYVPVPCEESCPSGAIHKNELGREEIDYSKCIYCGKCMKACPFGAVVEKSQIIEVIKNLKSEKKCVAMVAPAIAGQFPVEMDQLATAIRKLGFDYVVEVALGADVTTEVEAAEFLERIKNGEKMMGTSCCPAYIEAVKKHARDFEKYVSHAKTPMVYTARLVGEKIPGAVRIFIGPCVAKRHEALENSEVDYVLTFEELGALLAGKGIDLDSCVESDFDLGLPSKEGRGYPVSEGVAGAVRKKLTESGQAEFLKPTYINGFTRKNISLLRLYAKGKAPGNLIEVMSCEGGCISGPCVLANPKSAKSKLDELLQSQTVKEESD